MVTDAAVVSAPSLVAGPTDRPLLNLTVDQTLKAAVAGGAERPALIVPHQSVRYSYRDLDAAVEQVALGLLAHGLQPGDRIGIWAPNCTEWVLTMYAAARAGLILVNINPAYRTSELDYALKQVGCRALVFSRNFKGSNYHAMLAQLIPELSGLAAGARVTSTAYPQLQLLVRIGAEPTSGCIAFEDLRTAGVRGATGALARIAAAVDPAAPYNIQFTSGTTGNPKGATLTHNNIVNNAYFTAEGMRLTELDRVCVPVPLYHCFGMVMGVLATATHGAASVFPCDAFESIAVLEAVERERCTALYGVPTMFIAMLEHPRFKDFDLCSLRTGIMAGAPCPIAVMRRVIGEMHIPEVTICYGMTETSPVSFQSGCADSIERRVSTVGRVHPHVQVKIVDESGATTPRGQYGELLTRGYSVMHGYWGDPARTADAIDADGWMHTGDLGSLDADGYCNIVGRLKDLIIRGGENISPREVEEFLYRHPAVLDVAVIGVPDPKFGEAVCACIRRRDGMMVTEEEIREFCHGQIAHYKVPRYVRFIDAFPMTVTGKVQKFLLRDQLRAELHLVEEAHA